MSLEGASPPSSSLSSLLPLLLPPPSHCTDLASSKSLVEWPSPREEGVNVSGSRRDRNTCAQVHLKNKAPNRCVHVYLTQFFNNNMRPMKAIWRWQYLAKLLSGRGERKSSPREHELPWTPVDFWFERYLRNKSLENGSSPF